MNNKLFNLVMALLTATAAYAQSDVQVIPTTNFVISKGSFGGNEGYEWQLEGGGNIGYGYEKGYVTYAVNSQQDALYDIVMNVSNGTTATSTYSVYVDIPDGQGGTKRLATIDKAFAGTGDWGIKTDLTFANVPIPAGECTITIFGKKAADFGTGWQFFCGNIYDIDFNAVEGTTGAATASQQLLSHFTGEGVSVNTIPTTNFNIATGTFTNWQLEGGGNIGFGYQGGSVRYPVYSTEAGTYTVELEVSNATTDVSTYSLYVETLDADGTPTRVAEKDLDFTGTGDWGSKTTINFTDVDIPAGPLAITIYGKQAATNGFVGNIYAASFIREGSEEDEPVVLGAWTAVAPEGGYTDLGQDAGVVELFTGNWDANMNPKGTYIYQDIRLTKGVYDITMHGYYRRADGDASTEPGAVFFLQPTPGSSDGELTRNFGDVKSGITELLSADGADVYSYEADGHTCYYPWNRPAAALYFNAGYYQCEPAHIVVPAGGQTIRVGVRKECEGEWSAMVVGLLSVTRIGSEAVDVTISDAGYATLYNAETALAIPAGVQAYIVTAGAGGEATLEEVSMIPEGEPVVLKAAAGTYQFGTKSSEDVPDSRNLLRGSADGSVRAEAGNNYYYKLLNGSKGIGFYWGAQDGGADFGIGAGKAYLVLPQTAGVKAFLFQGHDGIATAILQLPTSTDAAIYDLSGRRVRDLRRHGIFIVGGNKVMR